MQCPEYHELLAAHVDRQLTAEEERLASAHLATCEKCARLREAHATFRDAFRARPWIQPTPPAVRQHVLTALANEPSAEGAVTDHRHWWRRPAYGLALAGALALAVVALTTPLLRSRSQPSAVAPSAVPQLPAPFAEVVAHYRAAEAGTLPLAFHTSDPLELRKDYHDTGAFQFGNTVVDLEPLGFVLVGGTVVDLGSKKSTLTVYRGHGGMIVCHRMLNDGMEPPPGGEVVGGDVFYTINGVTVCLHREGDVLCFLATALPRAEFIRRLTGHAGHAGHAGRAARPPLAA